MKYFCTPEKGIAMKIARIVLTASILLSLKSTVFCSDEKVTETPLTRKDSFDALRDGGALNGWLGWNPDALAHYTLDNCGKDYKGKEVRIGSKNTTSAWTTFGEKVDTLQKAQQFLAVIEQSEVQLPEQATTKSQAFIATENQRIADERAAKRAAGEHSFIELNQASKALLKALWTEKTVTRPATVKAIRKQHQDLCNAQLKQFAQTCQTADAQTAQQLQDNLKKLVALKTAHNSEFTELKDQIAKMPFAISEQAISGKGLAKAALQYKDFTAKSANSFAEAAKGNK